MHFFVWEFGCHVTASGRADWLQQEGDLQNIGAEPEEVVLEREKRQI